MGFFSGVTKLIGGGGEQSSQSASGFSLLPKEIQTAFKNYGSQVSSLFPSAGAANSMFTPMAQTADETRAFNLARQGIAPTSESIGRDISMLMNPFDDYVVNDINREAMGQNSLVNQAATLAGQQGSNRSFLGTSDVEQNRLNSIGKFRQDQYNKTIDNILGPLSGLRQADISNLLGIGEFQRGLDAQTRQAPLSALQAYGTLLGALPQTGGSTSTSSGSTSGGLGQTASGVASALALGGMFSDRDLKENIVRVGEENGFPVYEFNYIGDDQKFIGVIAQDIEKIMPEAVGEREGYKTVNYDMIGVKMRAI